MANIPYIYRIYGVFFNKCDELVCGCRKNRIVASYLAVMARPGRKDHVAQIAHSPFFAPFELLQELLSQLSSTDTYRYYRVLDTELL
eukprot:COSAG05_NODE_7297_length_831_cov_1.759563_1_plen_87_part_00